MSSPTSWRAAGLLACTMIATFTVAAVGTAAAASPAAQPTSCQMVIGKGAPGALSPVLSYECAAPGERLVAPAVATLLMTWYKGKSFTGDSTSIYGYYGPCDYYGYGVSNVGSGWNDKINSWKVFNSCSHSSDFQNINYGGSCGTYSGNVGTRDPYDTFGISSFYIANSTYAWDVCID
jgi:hypothetical protein